MAQHAEWEFLTGDKNALYQTASRDYLLSAVDSGNSNFIHTQYVALLDRQRRIRGFYDGTNKESISKLESDIKTLLKEPCYFFILRRSTTRSPNSFPISLLLTQQYLKCIPP